MASRGWVRSGVAASLLGVSLLGSVAHAQSGKAAAQALFDDGKRLMNEGKYAEACPKLAASQDADPGAGTLLNLAACYEKQGKTASAWVTYTDAVTASRRAGHPDWAKKAQAKVDALKPALLTLTITVDHPLPDLEIRRDGALLARGEWGAPIPVDPGGHEIEATATGKKPWKSNVEVTKSMAPVLVPKLEDEPTDAPAATAPRAQSATPAEAGSNGAGQRVLGLSVATVGLVGIAVGAVFGLKAMSSQSDADKHCVDAGTRCDSTGFAENQSAHSSALVATVGFVAGGVLLAGGGVLFFTAPKKTTASVQAVKLQPLPGGGMLGLRGTF